MTLTTEEINFAFEVWKTFPERIVGFPARHHFWDEKKRLWRYSSATTNEFSIILTNAGTSTNQKPVRSHVITLGQVIHLIISFAAFLHRKYAKLFVENLSVSVTAALQTYSDCEHILMNFLVSLVSKKPPVKVTHRTKFQVVSSSKNQTQMTEEFSRKQTCINIFFSGFGQMPLIKSKLRLDPVLFKDPVSNLRKKFRKIELAQ